MSNKRETYPRGVRYFRRFAKLNFSDNQEILRVLRIIFRRLTLVLVTLVLASVPLLIVLSSSNERSFWPAFQKRWAALLCDKTEGLRAWSEAMTRALGRGIIEVPNSADAHAALDNLNTRLARLESVNSAVPNAPLDADMCSHFVRYGAALLSSPVGVVAPYELTYEDLRLVTGELCEWLQLLKLVPRQVFLLGDFDSQIIGRAIALQLGVSSEIVSGDDYARSKSLIVSADSRNLSAASLRLIFPGQTLYALNLHPQIGRIVPDVASLAWPETVYPWQQERMSSRKITAFTDRINNATSLPLPNDWQTRLEFYRARRSLLTAGTSAFNRQTLLHETL